MVVDNRKTTQNKKKGGGGEEQRGDYKSARKTDKDYCGSLKKLKFLKLISTKCKQLLS